MADSSDGKNLLAVVQQLRDSVENLSVDLHPHATRKSATELIAVFGRHEQRARRGEDLAALEASFRAVWNSARSLEGLPAALTSRWPLIAFTRLCEQTPIAASDGFLEALDKYSRSHLLTRLQVGTLCRGVLSIEWNRSGWSQKFRRWLAERMREPALAAQPWAALQSDFAVLSDDAPRRLAGYLIDVASSADDPLSQLGIPSDCGGIRSEASIALLQMFSTIKAGEIDLRLAQTLTGACDSPATSEWSRTHIAQVVESATRPFWKLMPAQEVRKHLRDWIIGTYGDPRIADQHAYRQVASEAQATLRRWIAESELEEFFRVIHATANRRQWADREEFWLAAVRAGVIDDVWVVFGPQAAAHAKSGASRGAYGRLRQEPGVDPAHSVMLIMIGSLVVVEGSHNWACRSWRVSSPDAPRSGLFHYSRVALLKNAQWKKVHLGRWQRDVRDHVRRETGRAIPIY